MARRMSWRRGMVVAAGMIAMMAGSPLARGQGAGTKPVPAVGAGPSPKEAEAAIRPMPPEAIPDDPPPHEGAMFEISYRIEAPDLVIVEVLEALPGKPITGERLVRPDGTISLGWYGDVHVAGLTCEQAKVKIIHHLRPVLIDEALGLVTYDDGNRAGPVKPSGTVEKDHVPPPVEPRPAADDMPALPAGLRPLPGDKPIGEGDPGVAVKAKPAPEMPAVAAKEAEGKFVWVAPEDSNRVFVEVSAYNSKIYYVLGDTAKIGRFPSAGNETVLDAIQFSGGLLPSADRKNIRLYRPARGGKPARSYKIDFDAIEKGDHKANLQVFPGDRLLIERKANLVPRS